MASPIRLTFEVIPIPAGVQTVDGTDTVESCDCETWSPLQSIFSEHVRACSRAWTAPGTVLEGWRSILRAISK
jgi:hypothetical protein